MAGNHRPKHVAEITGNSNGHGKGRQVFRLAFVHCLEITHTSINAAARWLKRSPETIRGWVNGTHRIDFEAVYLSQKLWPHFFRCLVMMERKARRV